MITKNNKTNCEEMTVVSLNDLVPQDHLLRKIDKYVNFDFIYPLVEDMYSTENGRPSIDPVVLFKIVFIQYMFGIRSMRQTIEEIKVNIAYRWFLGYGFYDEIPHHSTFNKNYTRRFQNTTIFQDIFKKILEQVYDAGYIKEDNVFVDSTHIKAYANKNKKREATITESLTKYEKQLNKEINENRVEENKKEFKFEETKTVTRKESTTDPESGYYAKGEHEKCFAYSAQTACDENGYVLGTVVVPGNVHEDNKNLIAPYTRPKTKEGYMGKKEFTYDKENDCFVCPAGLVLKYSTTNRNGYREYKAPNKECEKCPLRNQCTKSKKKTITRHIHQKHIDFVEEHRLDEVNKIIYGERKKTIERVFGDTKYKQALGITTLRGIQKNLMRVLLIFACHNMKKMALRKSKDIPIPKIYEYTERVEENSSSFYSFLIKIINICKQIKREVKIKLTSLFKLDFVYSLILYLLIEYFYYPIEFFISSLIS